MIRTIEFCGNLIQGECVIETVRNFHTGDDEPTGFGAIRMNGAAYRGKLIETDRKEEATND